jgi:hypothetical protein
VIQHGNVISDCLDRERSIYIFTVWQQSKCLFTCTYESNAPPVIHLHGWCIRYLYLLLRLGVSEIFVYSIMVLLIMASDRYIHAKTRFCDYFSGCILTGLVVCRDLSIIVPSFVYN